MEKYNAGEVDRANHEGRPAAKLWSDQTNASRNHEAADRVGTGSTSRRPGRHRRSAAEIMAIKKVLKAKKGNAHGKEDAAELKQRIDRANG